MPGPILAQNPSDGLKSGVLWAWWSWFIVASPEHQMAFIGATLAVLYTCYQFWVSWQRGRAADAQRRFYEARLQELNDDQDTPGIP